MKDLSINELGGGFLPQKPDNSECLKFLQEKFGKVDFAEIGKALKEYRPRISQNFEPPKITDDMLKSLGINKGDLAKAGEAIGKKDTKGYEISWANSKPHDLVYRGDNEFFLPIYRGDGKIEPFSC